MVNRLSDETLNDIYRKYVEVVCRSAISLTKAHSDETESGYRMSPTEPSTQIYFGFEVWVNDIVKSGILSRYKVNKAIENGQLTKVPRKSRHVTIDMRPLMKKVSPLDIVTSVYNNALEFMEITGNCFSLADDCRAYTYTKVLEEYPEAV